MASVKIKFRPSCIDKKEGCLYYQVIHKRVVRQLKTNYKVLAKDWDNGSMQHLGVDIDLKLFNLIIRQLDKKLVAYSADDVISIFQKRCKENTLFNYMRLLICNFRQMGKHRTSETYYATLKSFMKYRENNDVAFDEIDSDMMLMYEAFLHNNGVTKNTSSFYMRILRAVYNRAVEKELTEQRLPFKHVYTGVDKTVKRAVPLKIIKQIKNLDLSLRPSLDFARDMFLFSFYTRGMAFIDIAHLKTSDLNNGVLSYRRHKTGQQLFIKWEDCMKEIVEKYKGETFGTYLMPIFNTTITTPDNNRTRYKNVQSNINKNLKIIAKQIDISIPLSLYVARHSWASIAKSKNIPISVISEGMGHDNELTTQIYLASLDNSVVDKANAQILKEL